MVYDCFIFFNEIDLLEIRLNELNNVVDKFVIIEANKTFQNHHKPYYFEENKERFSQFSSKIIHIKLDKYPLFIPIINPFTPWKLPATKTPVESTALSFAKSTAKRKAILPAGAAEANFKLITVVSLAIESM